MQVSADSLVNFVRKDFEWRTGKPSQIEPEDWKEYFYDNSRSLGLTIVMVTHDRSLARQADRILILKDGKLEKPAP